MKTPLRYYIDNNGLLHEIPDLSEFWSYYPNVFLCPITYESFESLRKKGRKVSQ